MVVASRPARASRLTEWALARAWVAKLGSARNRDGLAADKGGCMRLHLPFALFEAPATHLRVARSP